MTRRKVTSGLSSAAGAVFDMWMVNMVRDLDVITVGYLLYHLNTIYSQL